MSVEVLPLLSTAERAALVAQANQPARSKYRARRCDVHTPSHASQKECRYYAQLLLQERAGMARNIRQQVRYYLDEARRGERPVAYVADFVVEIRAGEKQPWLEYVIDVKGFKTPAYILKKRWMRQRYGIEIQEA